MQALSLNRSGISLREAVDDVITPPPEGNGYPDQTSLGSSLSPSALDEVH